MDCHDEDVRSRKTDKIRALNDRLRRTGTGGRVMMTRAIAALPPAEINALIRAVRVFDAFDRRNDPWGEHDFGKVTLGAQAYFWKIDAYDLNLEFGSPDASDEAVTRRVLTIMTGDDI
ncbi:hypothetical protein NS277_04320 [Novosphingobium barchaimii]|nr:hypothetical protein NS277_04320 [Novosphingobium barchaimii]